MRRKPESAPRFEEGKSYRNLSTGDVSRCLRAHGAGSSLGKSASLKGPDGDTFESYDRSRYEEVSPQ